MIRVLWKSGGSKIYTFGSTLTPHFLWRWPKSKKRSNRARKLQPLSYWNMSKSRLYLLSPFLEKYDYFLHYLGYFSQERERGHRSEEQNQNLTYPISPTRFLVNFLCKKIGSNTFQLCGYRSQKIFKFGCFSWYHAYIFEKNGSDILVQNLMLNRLNRMLNFKSQNEKPKS